MKHKGTKWLLTFVFTVLIIIGHLVGSKLLMVVSALAALLLALHLLLRLPVAPLVSVFTAIATLEVALRFFTDNYKTYTERIGYGYISMYQEPRSDWYYRYGKNSEVKREQTEFSYIYQSNSIGIFAPEPGDVDTSKYTILCLGDSFTEGVGAAQDSSWPAFLQRKLDNFHPDSFNIINAGIGGSDLFFMWKLYEDVLEEYYSPDEVILFMGDSDLEDVFMRQGDARFLPDSTLEFHEAPWFEPLFKYSYTMRLIVLDILNFKYSLVSEEQYKKGINESCELIKNKIEEIGESLQQDKVVFTCLIHPQPRELEKDAYDSQCFKELALFSEKYNVIDFLNEKEKYGLELPDNYNEYYWPIDGHFTAKGYEFLAEVIGNRYIKHTPNSVKTKTLNTDSL